MTGIFNLEGITFGNTKGNWRVKSQKLGLPLYYKDKQSNSNKSKKEMIVRGLLGAILLYGFYVFLRSGKESSGTPGSWKVAQQEVKDVFLESWHSYEKHAWGKDVYRPVSKTGKNMGPKPLGWMIVDSLDTMMLMGCDEEVSRARKWIRDDLDYNFDYEVNVFETTIRMLGGLLSAHHLSKDDLYLDKAAKLALSLLGGFESKTGIPYSSVNLMTGQGVRNHVDNGASSTAEVSTLQLEFKYLAHLTGENLYWEKAEKVMEVLYGIKPKEGLVPIYVHPDSGQYQGSVIRLGSRGDSYYEYLLKQYLQTNQQEKVYWDMYRESVEGVKKYMVGKSSPSGLTFIGELNNGIGGELSPKMDHLVCFYGGLLAVGATGGRTLQEARQLKDWTAKKEEDFRLGEELTYACYKMYHDVPSGLSPEIVVFNTEKGNTNDFYIKPRDKHNLQRPETVESLFYLYRLTGDEKYRKYGYEIFKNFLRYTKVTDGSDVSYTTLEDVTRIPPTKGDNTESFWFAETLKYLYLLFDDNNLVPLDKYVFNTEAHPFPRFDLGNLHSTGWTPSPSADLALEDPRIDLSKISDVPNKQKPPKAAPADKPADVQAQEVAKEHPEITKDNKKEQKQKFNKYVEQIV